MCLAIATYYLFDHILLRKLSKDLVAVVIINMHVFDFLIHLGK